MKNILISAGDLSVQAELNDSDTARNIWDSLPIEGTANLWGDEIYFDISLEIDPEEDARAEVDIGDLGYWPLGPAFCIFFGRTPVSTGDKPKAYSPVNVFGRVTGDPALFKAVSQGVIVKVTAETSA